ncbi:MAG: hypothetical protein GY810_29640 [Aureispira sp.]|nr:hypothetical protein [Aureispira sp.]
MQNTDAYTVLDDQDDDVEPIDYTVVSALAKDGLKNPRMIAHAMGLPVDWFTDTYKTKVELAIERGLSTLVMETTDQIRANAAAGDFQSQKYILQNIDETWTDKREVVNKNEFDIAALPNLRELFNQGIADAREEKVVNSIDGEIDDST